MRLFLYEDNFHYEMENTARLFFWQLDVVNGEPGDYDEEYCYARADKERLYVRCFVNGTAEDDTTEWSGDKDTKETEYTLAVMMFRILCRLTGKRPPFGVMTGIRPAKYTAALMREGLSADEAERYLTDHALLTERKARLVRLTAENGRRLGEKIRRRGYSLYVSIPFCPSRCSYCSFVSKSIERDRKLMAPYVDALCRELEHTARIAEELELSLQTIYIGGGTPSVLTAELLKKLTDCIDRCFPKPLDGEYCVEAGRPDTVTREKLRVLKQAGVTRISINPQTGNDEVLRRIGRKHTAADVEECYRIAREEGFDNINADLIAGLPGDDLESFRKTIDWVKNVLDPENVTVHALTLKRASRMREDMTEVCSPDAAAMVDWAEQELLAGGYEPYYMYRQKGTVDSLENTGYAKPGTECLYNLFIMDELQTIIACGAGAVTKLRDDDTGHIERLYDYKYPVEYLDGIGDMLARKDGIKDFYKR